MKKLNKFDLVEIIAEKTMITKKEVREILDNAFELIQDALVKNREVNITNFGVFTPKLRLARVGTHPKSHKKIEIESSSVVTFKMSKNFKTKLNNK